MKKIFAVLLMSFFCVISVFAQIETNKEELNKISIKQSLAWKEAANRAKQYADANNIVLRKELDDGTVVALVDVVNGKPVYFITDNIGAAATTRASELWENPNFSGGITGAGFDKVAVWDGGRVRASHQEFNNTGISRVIFGDNASLNDHATHVAGTIIAAGVDANAKGMAFEASLKSYYWDDVLSEMATAAINGYVISNHSWGYITGWYNDDGDWIWYGDSSIDSNEDYSFGYYSENAQDWDEVCFNAPYFLVMKSAGNDRSQGPEYAGTQGYPEVDGGEDGYDCISHQGVGKNVMTVGAVMKVQNYTGPESVEMTYFSGWGPVDDGRIKPDIVACGYSVYSAGSSSDTKYSIKSGTSMATPNATGSLVLLHDYYERLYGENMRSATIKALAIHTADECGPNEGPDYMNGWGLLNVERGASLIKDNASKNTIDELVLNNNQIFERTISVLEGEPLRVTICWTDPYGPVHAPALNNRAPVLINDLDLKVVDGSGNTYYPYKLDPDNPSAPATKNSPNNVDNVEQVYIESPSTGNYKIVVSHKNSLQNGSQAFSLITSYDGTWILSDDATLSNLTVNHGVLTPDFSSEVVNYTVNVPYNVTNITVIGTVNYGGATIEGNGIHLLNAGTTPIEIIVTAENGIDSKTYTVNVIREEPSIFQITASVQGGNGSIVPSNIVEVTELEDQIFTIIPDAGFKIETVLVDGENNTTAVNTGSYTFTNVTENHTILATFTVATHTITATSGSNGTIDPIGTVTLNYGESQTYVFKPNQGYKVNVVLIDGVIVEELSTQSEYTFEEITENHTIRVVFTQTAIGVSDVDYENEYELFPNPTKDKFVIKSLNKIIEHVKLYDLSGSLLLEKRVNSNSVTIDMSNYKAGTYILNVDGKRMKVVKS